jgi:O-6-methylguanine DNA methyltransferase
MVDILAPHLPVHVQGAVRVAVRSAYGAHPVARKARWDVGTTLRSLARTVPPRGAEVAADRRAAAVPWDVPVALHLGHPSQLRVRQVRLDVALPTAPRPTTHLWVATAPASATTSATTSAGTELLAALAPDRAGIERAWPGVATDVDASDDLRPLTDLLEELGVDEPLRSETGGRGSVPVLVGGTELQHRVLAALLRVPAGTTITYAALAAAADAPRAVRAAARTMAVNRVPLVVPCHRVVPSTGGVGRYAWGAPAKAALLDAEARRDVPARVGSHAGDVA